MYYMYIQKESMRGIIIKIRGFSNFKGFHKIIKQSPVMFNLLT